MQTFVLWQQLSRDLNNAILEAARTHDKKLYRRAVQSLSQGMRRSAQVMMELPRDIRHGWFHKQLCLPESNVLGHNLVINWLRTDQLPLVVMFMDGLNISHDGKGSAKMFPPQPPEAELERVCRLLYENFPAEQVTLYLSLFEDFTDVEWKLERFVSQPLTVSGG